MASPQASFVLPLIGTRTLIFDVTDYQDSSISEEIASVTSVTVTALESQSTVPTANGSPTIVTPANQKIGQQFRDTSAREVGAYNVAVRWVTDQGSPNAADHTHNFRLVVEEVGSPQE